MPKITVERSNLESGPEWSAYLGDTWEPGQPISIGTTPGHAIGALIPNVYQTLGIKLSGPAPEPGDAKAVLGGIIRAYAKDWGIEVDIREETIKTEVE